jgi:hypothetical protein
VHVFDIVILVAQTAAPEGCKSNDGAAAILIKHDMTHMLFLFIKASRCIQQVMFALLR